MATMAANFRRPEPGEVPGGAPPECWSAAPDPFQLRPLPSEDVYLYCKKIDNSRLVKVADPAAGRKRWRAISMSLGAAVFIMILMLPDALRMFAGYQVHDLERQHNLLVLERTRLDVQEAALLSPQRLEQLARDLRLVDPDPAHVVYLEPRADGALAMNVPKQ
jgi:hypothetical protein